MATLHLDASTNGGILLDLHAEGLAQLSLFIIYIDLFPDSLLILALWPLQQGSPAHTPLRSSACLCEYVFGRTFILYVHNLALGMQMHSGLLLATHALPSFPQKRNVL